MKASALVERMSPVGMRFYARMCGWTLARAHARSGDPIAIAEYLGTDDTFDNAIADFSARYADQNQRDYDSLRQSHSRRPNSSCHRDLSQPRPKRDHPRTAARIGGHLIVRQARQVSPDGRNQAEP